MNSHWWPQIVAVIRLEMRKTFFSRRGLWVYLLALAPVGLFLGHSLSEISQRDQRVARVAANPLTRATLESIQPGMTRDEVVAKLGQSDARATFGRRRHVTERLGYTDGSSDFWFVFVDGELVSTSRRDRHSLDEDKVIFATVFQFFYLRLAIFFGCVGIFMNLFRGEMIDKSLHFYLLAPIRREVLLVAKYLAGLIATTVIFTTSTALQLWTMSLHFDSQTIANYLHGPGWSHVAQYLGVTVLACLGYGSVFLAAGLLFRNPLIPAAIVLVWEAANIFLPAALKKISVIFYLQSLCPVVAPPDRDTSGLLGLLISAAEPVGAAWAITGLLGVTLAVLTLASFRARTLEINYGSD
jgi:ABC-type transport system involved in multi-copper enzyme maturation permease subunit